MRQALKNTSCLTGLEKESRELRTKQISEIKAADRTYENQRTQ